MSRTLSDLFPSKKLTPQEVSDLYRGGVVLTIKSVEIRFSEQDQSEYAVVYFRESKKPMGLNKTNAQQIADMAGTEDLDAWAGVQVKLFAMPIEIPDPERPGFKKQMLGLRVFPPKPGEQPPAELVPGSDWTVLRREMMQRAQRLGAGAAAGQLNAKPIGMDSAIGMVIELEARGKSIDFAVTHLSNLSFGPQIVGKVPPEWPETIKAPLKKLLAGFPSTVKVDRVARADELRALWTPPPAEPEVIDPKTGEVISKRAGTGKPGEEIDPDDIPF